MLFMLSAAAIFIVAAALAIAEIFWPFTLAAAGLVAWGIWGDETTQQTLWSLLNWRYITPYVLIGLGWLFFKWTRVVESALKDTMKRVMKRAEPTRFNLEAYLPRWQDHSYDLAPHFFYWPLSMVAYVLHDLLFDLWDYLSDAVAGLFNKYAEHRFSKLKIETDGGR